MSRFPQRPGVTSRMRLRDHDYSEKGMYFLTVCVNDWTHRLGEVVDNTFLLSLAGSILLRLWETLPERFPGASTDASCVMPNHFHGIVGLGVRDGDNPPYPSISQIMNWFKSASTLEYFRGVKRDGWPRYEQRLWLDGYYDHVIRDERDLQRIREYIDSNPSQWHRDVFLQRE